MKLPSSTPCFAFSRATSQASMPLHGTAFSWNSLSSPFSFRASATAWATPPLRAKFRPKGLASSSGPPPGIPGRCRGTRTWRTALVGQGAVNGVHGAAQLELLLFATQGPMKITLASGSFSLDVQTDHHHRGRGGEIKFSISGCFFLMYPTKPGQQEEHSIPFSTSSSDSRSATISAPRATSATR